MKNISRELARKMGAPIRCVEKECRGVTMIELYPWQAKEWSLPYSRLDAVSFCREAELERIELFFAHHHVIVLGENLQDALDEIRTFEVYCLRSLPESYRASFGPRDAFIVQLEVRLLADAKAPSSA